MGAFSSNRHGFPFFPSRLVDSPSVTSVSPPAISVGEPQGATVFPRGFRSKVGFGSHMEPTPLWSLNRWLYYTWGPFPMELPWGAWALAPGVPITYPTRLEDVSSLECIFYMDHRTTHSTDAGWWLVGNEGWLMVSGGVNFSRLFP